MLCEPLYIGTWAEMSALDSVLITAEEAASVAIADGLGDTGDRRNRKNGGDVRSEIKIEAPSWWRAVVWKGPMLERGDNRIFEVFV